MIEPTMNQYAPPRAQVADVAQGAGVAELNYFSAQGRIGRLRYLAYGTGASLVYYVVLMLLPMGLAGTTAMNNRQDALLAAAKFIEAVNRIVTSVPGRQVGTVGRINALPGAPNVIPGKVVLSLELRDLDATKINMLFEKIQAEAQKIAAVSKTKFDFKEINVNIPAPTNPKIRSLISEAARELGLTTKLMPSGAGHDAQDMARLGPVGMIFVPSVAGISHSPREFSRSEDIANGANVLLHTLLKLDQ